MKVETTVLAEAIEKCFDLSMDGRVSDSDQLEFLASGKRLRGNFVNLVSARFKDGTQAVLDANNKIASVNTKLATVLGELNKIADTVKALGDLAKTLDDLVKIAASFI